MSNAVASLAMIRRSVVVSECPLRPASSTHVPTKAEKSCSDKAGRTWAADPDALRKPMIAIPQATRMAPPHGRHLQYQRPGALCSRMSVCRGTAQLGPWDRLINTARSAIAGAGGFTRSSERVHR
jgi:hypothetical protein